MPIWVKQFIVAVCIVLSFLVIIIVLIGYIATLADEATTKTVVFHYDHREENGKDVVTTEWHPIFGFLPLDGQSPLSRGSTMLCRLFTVGVTVKLPDGREKPIEEIYADCGGKRYVLATLWLERKLHE